MSSDPRLRLDDRRHRRHRPWRPSERAARLLLLCAVVGCSSLPPQGEADRAQAAPPVEPVVPSPDGARAEATSAVTPAPAPPASEPLVLAPNIHLPDLNVAATEGDLARVRALLAKGANIDAPDDRGTTALMAALRKYVEEPKTSGANPKAAAEAKQRGARKLQVAVLLIERGANVRPADVLGHTALHYAATTVGPESEVVRIIDLLVARGADVNQRTDARYARTPLEYAVDQSEVGRVSALLGHGAVPGGTTAEGKSLQALADERGHHAIAERLRAATAKRDGR